MLKYYKKVFSSERIPKKEDTKLPEMSDSLPASNAKLTKSRCLKISSCFKHLYICLNKDFVT